MSAEPKPTVWVNVFIFLVTGYTCIFVQARLTSFRDLFGVQFDLLPGLMVYAALSFKFWLAILLAGFLGLLMDVLSANPLGVSMLAYLLVSVGAWYFRELLLSDQFTGQFALGSAVTAATAVISVIILFIVDYRPLLGFGSIWQWLLVSTGGGAFTPVWFRLFTWLDEAFRYKEMPESSFRPDREIARGRY